MSVQASLLLHNARVLTMDAARPRASAVAVGRNGCFLAVGDGAELSSLCGPATHVIDCRGLTVVPGFIDAHCHIMSAAAHLLSVDCSPAAVSSIADIQAAIKQRAVTLPSGQWLRAVGYDESDLAERRHPTRWELDAAAPAHPVRLIHRTGHACVLNSLALRLAGIDITTEEPPGGHMERDLTTGEPTGLLLEMDEIIDRVVPRLADDELDRSVKLVSQHLLSQGVTCVQDASVTNGPDAIARLRRLHDEQYLRQRLSALVGYQALEWLVEERRRQRMDVAGVKIALSELGDEIYPAADELGQMLSRADAAGIPAAVHAVSEAAVAITVAAFAKALVGSRRHLRHRIEHASECPPLHGRRIARLGLTVVTQPAFIYHNGDRYLRTVERRRLPHLYPLRSLLAAGVPVAAASDAPVAPASPLLGLYGAVARRSRSGQLVAPEQAITVEEALAIHTLAAARAIAMERVLGSITPGKRADLVVLSADPTNLTADELLSLRVEMTVLDGEIVWYQGGELI